MTPRAGTKRKAEEQLHPGGPDRRAAGKQSLAKPASIQTTTGKARPNSVSIPSRPLIKPSTTNENTASPKPPTASSSKPPPKGSYADLMLKAKAAQEKAPVQVGVLKHQPVPKERLSKAEKKKRAMEAMAKEKEARLAKKSALKPGGKPVEGGSIKRREPVENAYKGTARPTQPMSQPTPQPTPQPTYKGTAGLASRHRSENGDETSKVRRAKVPPKDEYLGTDEEDEGDFYGDDYNDYYSDESSDMEGGFEDVEREEEVALKVAREEDEEDIRKEAMAKKEKMERKKKLVALVKSRR
jgi:SPT2 chromatin protein